MEVLKSRETRIPITLEGVWITLRKTRDQITTKELLWTTLTLAPREFTQTNVYVEISEDSRKLFDFAPPPPPLETSLHLAAILDTYRNIVFSNERESASRRDDCHRQNLLMSQGTREKFL